MYLAMPLVLLRIAWRGVGNRAYWSRVAERFGLGPPLGGPGGAVETLWLHAVSVGEVQAALPLVRALRARRPQVRMVMTTTTPTGMERVRHAFGSEVIHRYAPYDLPGATRRFLDRVEPRLAIFVETEIWPNLVHQCHRRAIPVLFANARLSERSAAGYRRLGGLMRQTLTRVAAIAAQSEEDARRLREIGAPFERVVVTGSTKFDVAVSASTREAGQVLRRQLGVERSVWIAASTHEGEEEQVLEAFAIVRRAVPACLLVLVPRHPERFARVAALCRRQGFQVSLRSGASEGSRDVDVFVGDTMGELPVFYAASDVAFVGGSLVDVGGHNMLEPAALGVPVLLGPSLRNFADISDRLCRERAAEVVEGVESLALAVIRHLGDANLRHRTGECGRRFVERNRGAGERVLALVERSLAAAPSR